MSKIEKNRANIRRKSRYDYFVYYYPPLERTILTKRDCVVNGIQEWWMHDGERSWWIKKDPNGDSVILLDRAHERYYNKPFNIDKYWKKP